MSSKENWKILKEDKHLLVVSKPSGLVVQGARKKEESLLYQVKAFLKLRDEKKGNVFLAVVHRLDKPVSGAIVFAKRSKVASRIFQTIKKCNFQKVYLGVVEGKLTGSGLLVDYLRYREDLRRTIAIEDEAPEHKRALTYFEVLSCQPRQTILLLSPITGRRHQLRVSLSRRGFPIVGDQLYGSRINLSGKILLHCLYLRFPHPKEERWEEIFCPGPAYFPQIFLDKAFILDFLKGVEKFLKPGGRDVSSKGLA